MLALQICTPQTGTRETICLNLTPENPCLIGIQRRGVPLAERIAAKIAAIEGQQVPVGILDITPGSGPGFDDNTLGGTPSWSRPENTAANAHRQTIIDCKDSRRAHIASRAEPLRCDALLSQTRRSQVICECVRHKWHIIRRRRTR